jgi:predicted nucleic acid-binding protein
VRCATRSIERDLRLIVLDASAAVELVLVRPTAAAVEAQLLGERMRVPAHFDAEVLATVRKALRLSRIEEEQARVALFHLRGLRAERIALTPLLAEAFALRDRISVYDAFYAIVARLSEATLVTCDRGLARAAKGYCEVEYVALK